MTGGFSLLELLVAVLVVAVGALGVAGLQLASIQNNRGAMQYSVTTALATDLVERMRANPGADYAPTSAPRRRRSMTAWRTTARRGNWRSSTSRFGNAGSASGRRTRHAAACRRRSAR